MQALIDYLVAGRPLDEFLDDFPSVTREQTVAALEEAKRVLVSGARTVLTKLRDRCDGRQEQRHR